MGYKYAIFVVLYLVIGFAILAGSLAMNVLLKIDRRNQK